VRAFREGASAGVEAELIDETGFLNPAQGDAGKGFGLARDRHWGICAASLVSQAAFAAVVLVR